MILSPSLQQEDVSGHTTPKTDLSQLIAVCCSVAQTQGSYKAAGAIPGRGLNVELECLSIVPNEYQHRPAMPSASSWAGASPAQVDVGRTPGRLAWRSKRGGTHLCLSACQQRGLGVFVTSASRSPEQGALYAEWTPGWANTGAKSIASELVGLQCQTVHRYDLKGQARYCFSMQNGQQDYQS